MAGDGGRVPDVSEQRAEILERDECPYCGEEPDGYGFQHLFNCPGKIEIRAGKGTVERRYVRLDDPASVLAALLAESPDATVAALEALLTSDEVVTTAEESLVASARSCLSDAEAATFALSAACRSLLPKAPKEDHDA
jgi:hypothetical protein